MNINDLKYYVRFVFNCSDGLGFSTDSSDHLKKFVKSYNTKQSNERFNIGDQITVKWTNEGDRLYSVSKIEIRDLRYDTDEKLYGVFEDDRGIVTDEKERFSLMTIFIFLTAVENKTNSTSSES